MKGMNRVILLRRYGRAVFLCLFFLALSLRRSLIKPDFTASLLMSLRYDLHSVLIVTSFMFVSLSWIICEL